MKVTETVKNLFLSYRDSLHRFVYQKLGNSEDAEEIVQDAFHNYLKIEEKEKVENPQAFLYKTAHNLALNHIRKNGYRKAHLETTEADPKTLTLEAEVVSQVEVEMLQNKLNQLPEQTQKIFLANRIEGKTYPEIGLEYGISVSKVQKHISKALNFLRLHLER